MGRDGRRAAATRRAPAQRGRGGRAQRRRLRRRRRPAADRRPVVHDAGRARRLRGGDRRQGPARPAADRPRRADRASARRGEADARARARALAVGRPRDRGSRGDHRARRARSHLGGLRHRRRRDRRLLGARAHRPHPRQRPDGGRRARRRLQRDDADVLARLRDVGRIAHHGQHQLPQPAQRQGRLAPPDAAPVVPRPLGHLLQPRRAGDAADAALRAGADRHRRRHGGARRRRRGAAPSRRARAGVRRRRARAERGHRPGGGGGRAQPAPGPHHRRRRRLRDRRGEGDPPLPREPAALAGRADAAVPRRAQARVAVPRGRALAPAGGRPDDLRHRLGGLTGRGADRGRAQAHARRLLAGARHGGRRPAADARRCRRR